MFGSCMEFKTIQDTLGFCWRKDFIKTSRRMSVELVLHNYNYVCIWKMDINQVTHAICPIYFGAAVGDFDTAPVLERSKEHKHVGDAFALILVIILLYLS